MAQAHDPVHGDTSDRLYTAEELEAFARQQLEASPEPTRPQGDPLSDPIPGFPSGPPPEHPPAEDRTAALPTVPRSWTVSDAAPLGPRPTSPPPAHRSATAVRPEPAEPVGPTPPPQPTAQGTPDPDTSDGTSASTEASEAPATEPRRFMSATDFLDRRDNEMAVGPASWGLQGRVRRWSGGLVQPRMSVRERAYESQRAAIQKDFDGPRTIAFINPKGGAAKTTGVLAAGYTFGTVRGGGVVAWDNNETRGTLGIRGTRSTHRNTTRELLEDLERFKDVYQSRIGDLGAFVRSQGDAHFDVLASDERPDVTGMIRAEDFNEVHQLLERFYRVILVDTGNNMRAENWLASAEAADLLVVTSTVREDTGYSGLWMLDALQDAGYRDLKRKTVTVLSDPSAQVDTRLAHDLEQVYEQRTRAVYRVPYDPVLVSGSVVPYAQLSTGTRMSWLEACAGMAAAL